MKRKTIISCFLLSMLVPISTLGWMLAPFEPRVVFLRGDELLTAKADGSDVRVLVKDNVRKADPRWSPDKTKIVYRIDGETVNDPKTHAELIVITADGRRLGRIPVLATESDGTIVGGMRFVEESGWLSNATLYATGSANPYIAEYRILDANTGRAVGGYLGTGFATCATKGQVAYATTGRARSGADQSQVEVNGSLIYTSSSDQHSAIDNLQWSNDCERLAFAEASEAAAKFVVIRGATREAEIPLRSGMVDSLTVINYENSFLLQAAHEAVYYDVITHSLRARPDIANNVNRIRMERERFLKRLGGASADGWTDNLPAGGARVQQGVIDLNGRWRTSDGQEVVIEQSGQNVKATFVAGGDCAGGEKRDFYIQGLLSGNSLTGTMKRCTRNRQLLQTCHLTDPYIAKITATVDQNTITGKYIPDYITYECKVTPGGGTPTAFSLTRSAPAPGSKPRSRVER